VTPQQLLKNLDWSELRLQKEFCIRSRTREANGLVCLIDAIQDCAEENKLASATEIFGETMKPNVSPNTGVRYGIIAERSLNSDVYLDIMSQGVDVYYHEYEMDIRKQIMIDDDIPDDEKEWAIEKELEAYYHDEPVYEFDIDGVSGRTTWLGGALLIWVFKSPVIRKHALCSPCVPNCGDLDSDGDYECYDVPDDWRTK